MIDSCYRSNTCGYTLGEICIHTDIIEKAKLQTDWTEVINTRVVLFIVKCNFSFKGYTRALKALVFVSNLNRGRAP